MVTTLSVLEPLSLELNTNSRSSKSSVSIDSDSTNSADTADTADTANTSGTNNGYSTYNGYNYGYNSSDLSSRFADADVLEKDNNEGQSPQVRNMPVHSLQEQQHDSDSESVEFL